MKKIYILKWFGIIGLPAFFSGFLVFYALYQSGSRSTAQTALLLQTQLIYILSEKDDMELIDFENFLKNSNPTFSLRASSNGKVIVSLGDPNETPTDLSKFQGFRFEFPNHWVAHWTESLPESSTSQLDLLFAFPLVPNPWSWALLDIVVCLLMGMGLKGLFPDTVPHPSKNLETPTAYFSSPSLTIDEAPIAQTSNSHPAQLRVDKGYLVKFASETAIALLQKKSDEIVGHHILDLSPRPALLEIFKQSQNAKIQNTFLTSTPIKAEVIKEEGGWLITLEKAENGQKH